MKIGYWDSLSKKLIILLAAVSFVVVGVNAFNVIYSQSLAQRSSQIITNEAGRLLAVQEILYLTLESSVLDFVSDAYEDSESHSINETQQDIEKFLINVVPIELLIQAIMWGGQSDEFSKINSGATAIAWKKLGYQNKFFVPVPFPEMFAEAGSLDFNFAGYKNNAIESFYFEIKESELLLSGDVDKSDFFHAESLKYKAKAIAYLGPINTSLKKIQLSLNNEMRDRTESLQSEIYKVRLISILVSIVGICIVWIICLIYFRRLILSPIANLTKSVKAVSEGLIPEEIVIKGKGEIGILVEAFNFMIKRLNESYSDMERRIIEKTNMLSDALFDAKSNNDALSNAQRATINLLEDLENEKKVVEMKVEDRTKSIKLEKEKLLQVTSHTRDADILLDKKGQFIFANEATYKLLNLPAEKLLDEVQMSVFSFFANSPFEKYFKECVDEGKSFLVEEIGAGVGVYKMSFQVLLGHKQDEGVVTGYFISITDITESKLLERSKSELVAVASHQLRTPLTAIRGNLEMLTDESYGPLNPEQHELLSDINISAIRLISMVNEMLDITKIEKGNLDLKIERIEVREMLESVVSDLETYAKSHDFSVKYEAVASGVFVNGDRMRLRQVFQNLTDNAIKYSRHPGSLEIYSEIKDNKLKISFKDNGIGVPAIEQGKLFGRFYRASNTAKSSSSGSGLGLYIIKSITKQLGGDIEFESVEDVGTTFHVLLPIVD